MREVQFDYTDDNGREGLLVYTVPDDTVISEDDAEADAESASMRAGTYPPAFLPVVRARRTREYRGGTAAFNPMGGFMEPQLSPEERREMRAYLDQLLKLIKERGYGIPFLPANHTTGETSLAYTVGLHVQRGFELAISGLSCGVSCSILNAVVVWLDERQAAPSPRMEISDLPGGTYPFRLVEAGSSSPFVMVRTVYGHNPPVWQVVWPDAAGRFPDDPGCALSPKGQPAL